MSDIHISPQVRKMKFSAKIYEKLIELVRQNPYLYDAALPQNKDTVLKNNIWTSIAHQMGDDTMTGEEWKKIWKNKRDAYMKKRREVQNAHSGSAAKATSKFPMYDQMGFLTGHVAGRSTVSNIEENTQQSSTGSCYEETSTTTDYDLSASDEICGSPAESEASRSAAPQPKPNSSTGMMKDDHTQNVDSSNRKRKRDSEALDSAIEKLCDRSDANMQLIKIMAANKEPDNIFFFIGRKLKNFKPATQSWLEDEAMRIYMEAKTRDSQQEQQEHQQPEQPNTYLTQTPLRGLDYTDDYRYYSYKQQ